MALAYMSNVEKRLGKDVVKVMLDSALSGEISDDKMKNIALELGNLSGRPNVVFGNHVQKMGRNNDITSGTALREILCDWWNDHLYDISQVEAINNLIQIFQMDNIGLRPLAKNLKEINRPQVTHILGNRTL